MKNISSELYIEKWKSSDTYKRISSELHKNAVEVNHNLMKEYFTQDNLHEFYISKYLFVNKDLVDILNFLEIRSKQEGSYTIINEYNKSLPVKWDDLNGKYFVKSGYELHPVVGISWGGAKFISQLFGGRLPYEIEWEISAKSGNKEYKFSWGNEEPDETKANYEENVGETSAVGKYSPNEIGLYDMAGNVEEWCGDSPLTVNGEIFEYEKIVKGGCWYKPANNLLCESKRTRWTKMSATGIGFRILWDKSNFAIIDN